MSQQSVDNQGGATDRSGGVVGGQLNTSTRQEWTRNRAFFCRRCIFMGGGGGGSSRVVFASCITFSSVVNT